MEAHIVPLIESAESPGSFYVSFMDQLQRPGRVEVFLSQADAMKSQDEFISARSLRIRQLLER
ncbi:hypothetical protein [Mycobacterium sp. Z3061]|uniref:hypothetical protein n=1 Tax=Mycobacterium sp. Z3061 TaxID=3073562 RepID=UPI002873DCA5|nr:hypothetical protein [Mycobacterium sp. Z3061]